MIKKKNKRLGFLGSLLFLTVGFSGTRILADDLGHRVSLQI
jgi:hypothetical protein